MGKCILIICVTCIVVLLNRKAQGYLEQDGETCLRDMYRAECKRLKFYHPWENNNDELCKDYSVKISEKSLRPMALVGTFLSGMQYLLQLVERTSGIMTKSVVPPMSKSGQRAHVACGIGIRDGNVILTGTFDNSYDLYPLWLTKYLFDKGERRVDWPTLSSTYFNYRGILLLRDPWMVIIAGRAKTRRKLGRACNHCPTKARSLQEVYDFHGRDFESYVSINARRWIEQLRSWISNSPYGSEMVIIKYEDLIENPEPEVRRVMKFLNQTVDEERLKCALNDPHNDY